MRKSMRTPATYIYCAALSFVIHVIGCGRGLPYDILINIPIHAHPCGEDWRAPSEARLRLRRSAKQRPPPLSKRLHSR